MSHGPGGRDALPDRRGTSTDHSAEVLREALTVIQNDQGSKDPRCSRVHSSPVLFKDEDFCFPLILPSLSIHFSAQSSYGTVNKQLTGKARKSLKGLMLGAFTAMLLLSLLQRLISIHSFFHAACKQSFTSA